MEPVTNKIELPLSMGLPSNVFHLSKLKPYHCSENDSGPLSSVIDVDGIEQKVVSSVLNKKREYRGVCYLIKFLGQPKSEAVSMHKPLLSSLQRADQKF